MAAAAGLDGPLIGCCRRLDDPAQPCFRGGHVDERGSLCEHRVARFEGTQDVLVLGEGPADRVVVDDAAPHPRADAYVLETPASMDARVEFPDAPATRPWNSTS